MVDAELHQRLVEFWNQDSDFDAKFRRILTNGTINAVADVAELDRMWEASTQDALKHILHGIPLDPAWSVLEIGAGVGRLLRPLSRIVAKAYGVDVSTSMVRYSEQYLRDTPNAQVLLNDGRSLSAFADGEVDFCYSILCFQHIPDVGTVRDYLKEIRRVLRPAGLLRIQVKQELPFLARLIVAVQRRDLRRIRSTSFRQWRGDGTMGFRGNRYSRRTLNMLLSGNGLLARDWQKGLGKGDWLWVTASRRP